LPTMTVALPLLHIPTKNLFSEPVSWNVWFLPFWKVHLQLPTAIPQSPSSLCSS
jgi:hypothetical protein